MVSHFDQLQGCCANVEASIVSHDCHITGALCLHFEIGDGGGVVKEAMVT
jgi:hypothetical protein